MTENRVRAETDWEAQLEDGEIGKRQEGNREITVVLLAGLRRLARIAGLCESDCEIITPDPKLVQCVYRVKFTDDTKWVGAADCSSRNTTGVFVNYPTAVAESRAEARALRNALGITMLSSEEIGFQEVSSKQKISGQQVKAIEIMCTGKDVSQAHALECALGVERASNVFELGELTIEEGQTVSSWLNNNVKKSSKRDERKRELQEKVKE